MGNVHGRHKAENHLLGCKGRGRVEFGIFENALQIRKECCLLIPNLAFDEKTPGGAGSFAILIGEGAWIDQAKGQLVNSLAGEARG